MIPAMPTPQPLRILLAEDNALTAEYGELLLARAGHRVHLASDGLEVLALCEQHRFDMILMDLEMPNMGGLAAAAAIRAGEMHTRQGLQGATTGGASIDTAVVIIALSAHMHEDDRLACLAAGMDGYLMKPLDVAAIHLTLESIKVRRSASGKQT